ncbi:MAG TPA: hypothetical protein PLB73_14555 [Leptospiraceae bacterium]|nr:hypothetical protein [Leptospiraceae bacterium]
MEKMGIEARIAERAESRHYDDADVKRVDSLSLSPLDSGKWGFDAAATSELFQKPVPAPDFRSWKFRFIRGPLKPLARKIYVTLAQMFDRMSENKTQAFYDVVHELADLRRENAQLKERIQALEAKSRQDSRDPAVPSAENPRPPRPVERGAPGISSRSGNRPRPL